MSEPVISRSGPLLPGPHSSPYHGVIYALCGGDLLQRIRKIQYARCGYRGKSFDRWKKIVDEEKSILVLSSAANLVSGSKRGYLIRRVTELRAT